MDEPTTKEERSTWLCYEPAEHGNDGCPSAGTCLRERHAIRTFMGRLIADVERLEREAAAAPALKEALEFYADAETYFGIGFFPDPPCGAFTEDFDETHLGMKPGAKARAALALLEPEA